MNEGLNKLLVIDRLEVGPVQVEKRRLIAPYRMLQGEEDKTFKLYYRYEEDVFDPQDSASQNLAGMIGVQVALNYALFCKEMIFHGDFDSLDRRFIIKMARNTAREIFVNKLLIPNQFVRGAASKVHAVILDHYDQADLEFPAISQREIPEAQPWSMDPSHHAVLSSGGKESLLSFGLLTELGYPTHPIFINESGRHWYTALNAYRHFRVCYPNTSRVWTNADRLFTWILRCLPFIRADFARVRSDYYPIRLWTVAVLVFGALPLLRKRRIGRLIIGDEFDTTIRATYKGITHFSGIYDQSRHFDRALSRYFKQKRWNIVQFSILRTLSELLVEKILVELYPHLQQLQMSCHAAHIKEGRVMPCGKCEKCRRVASMLIAIGADATRCGFKPEQMSACLKELGVKGFHQEPEVIQQLLFMLNLQDRGKSEVMKLRIDRQRSPLQDIPGGLRDSLVKIFLAHAEGALLRCGGSWIYFNPLKDRAFMGS